MENSEKKSFDRETAGSEEQTDGRNHPWNGLATVATFDRGNNMKPTLCINSTRENQGQIARITPSTSILIISLIQQLCTMFEKDKKARNKLYLALCDKLHNLELIDSSYNMMEFEALRGQYQRILSHLVSIARNETGSENGLQISYLMPEWSHYYQEFQEISFIAKGGFGQVFKARHRLDNIEYAIKKIKVKCSDVEIIMQQLREVKTLAKLNHPNIVPYKAAWIESTSPTVITNMPSKTYKSQKSCTSRYIYDESDSDSLQSNKDLPNNSNLSDSSEQDIVFDNEAEYPISMSTNTRFMHKEMRVNDNAGGITISQLDNEISHEIDLSTNSKWLNDKRSKQECIEEVSSDIVSFRNSQNSVKEHQTASNSVSSSSNEKSSSYQKVCTYISDKNHQYMTLYIQMALCEQTLERWMQERISTTCQQIVTVVFQQMLCGLDYIHSLSIVHHDIKPSNIFISTSGQLRIYLGDFGLACPLQRDDHHSVMGTRTYAAPEQLEGKCDPKSDIYSIGIVLAELLIPMQTQMELSHTINSLKQENIPEALIERHKWAQLIMQMIQDDPCKRPSTKQLLHNLNDKDMMIAELKDNLRDKDNVIQDRDNMIQELQVEIKLLREEIKKLKVPSEEI